jgi:hypothetical protein
MFVVAVGKSRDRGREKELHHLEVHAHPDASHESPAWIVEHHHVSPQHPVEEHEFNDHEQMLNHVPRA